MAYYDTCPGCGANLDPGERCDCQTSYKKKLVDIFTNWCMTEEQLVYLKACTRAIVEGLETMTCPHCGRQVPLEPVQLCPCQKNRCNAGAQIKGLLEALPADSPIPERFLGELQKAALDADTSQGGHTKKVIQPDDTCSIHRATPEMQGGKTR